MNSVEASADANPKYLGMAWYKFLTSCGLIASAVINFIYSVGYLTGSIYLTETNGEVTAEQVYAYYGQTLQALDILYGLFIISLGILVIILRHKLKNFEPNTMKFVYLICSLSVCVPLVYIILASSITDVSITDMAYTSLLTSLIVAIIHVRYFKKRAHLFIGLTETSNDLVQEPAPIHNIPRTFIENTPTNEIATDDVLFCCYCGTKLFAHGTFCHKCGRKIR